MRHRVRLAVGCSAVGVGRVLTLFKMLRAHRLFWWPRWMDPVRRKPVFQVVWLVMVLVTANHLVACIYFVIISTGELWEQHIDVFDRQPSRTPVGSRRPCAFSRETALPTAKAKARQASGDILHAEMYACVQEEWIHTCTATPTAST